MIFKKEWSKDNSLSTRRVAEWHFLLKEREYSTGENKEDVNDRIIELADLFLKSNNLGQFLSGADQKKLRTECMSVLKNISNASSTSNESKGVAKNKIAQEEFKSSWLGWLGITKMPENISAPAANEPFHKKSKKAR